ncbi:antibiotic biosynthesis monooxygenase [Bradyrhizobium sp. USDA 4520]
MNPSDGSEVTSVIRHKIRPDAVAKYEEWLKKIMPAARAFPGHRGVNVIRPHSGSTQYTVVLHFDSIDALKAWLDSAERKALVAEARPFFAGEDDVEIKTGLEFWFTPPSAAAAKVRPYKQMLATISVIYPLTIVVPFLFKPAFAVLPWLSHEFVRQLIVVSAIVAAMTYVIMPRYTKAIAGWLFR